MKETLTLLERCQREAKEQTSKLAAAYQSDSMEFDYSVLEIPEKDLQTYVSEAIANTLKQAAEALEGIKIVMDYEEQQYHYSIDLTSKYNAIQHNKTLTDAQKLLLGDDNK
jgi:hypothetical protein